MFLNVSLSFGALGCNIACFLSGDNCLLLGFIIYPRYLNCCFEICVFFWETLCPKEIKDFNVILIWWLHEEYYILSSTYYRIVPSFRCISLSLLVGPGWTSMGCPETIAAILSRYIVVFGFSRDSPLEGKWILRWGMIWDAKEGILEVRNSKPFSVSRNLN